MALGANPTSIDRRDRVSRLASADARKALEQIQSSPMVAEGQVCLVGLDAVRERMGERWPGRREMVYENVQSTLRRQLGGHGFLLRVSETDFLVAQPGVSRAAAQAYCFNCLREVLTYFLGEAPVSDVLVHEVSALADGRIDARRLDGALVAAEAERARREETARERAASELASQDRWTPFVSQDGRRLRVSSRLQPVFQLKSYARIGYRMSQRVLQLPGETPLSPSERRQLASADVERIDFATLARGMNRLQQEGGKARELSLILPVSFTTLSSQRGRAMLADLFRAAQASVQRGLICEVCDVDGVPPSTLLAATSLMRPFCLFIVGRVDTASPAALRALKDAGLHGVSIGCPPTLQSDDAFSVFANSVVGAARNVVKAVMLDGVASPHQAAIASLCGATHASFAPEAARTTIEDGELASA